METKRKTSTATELAGPKPSPLSGVAPPKERQFGQPNGNPRHNGAWKKEDTPRYKIEQMVKMTESEIVAIANDPNAPLFERRIARSLLRENDWKTTESIINQAYGVPKQRVEVEPIQPKPLIDLTDAIEGETKEKK